MRKYALLLLMLVLAEAGVALAADIPFIFGDRASDISGYSSDQLESWAAASPELAAVPPISAPKDDEILEFPITGGGNAPEGKTEKRVGDLKNVFNSRVEPENSRVHQEAVVLVAKYPGDLTIDQISSIYAYLKGDWRYVRDPRGLDYFMYANETLKVGERAECVGAGDCDDFAILMSALVESIGGTTRIILAHNNSTGGHAFSEVYLGQLNAANSQAEGIINWLRREFGTDKIYTHIDTETKDVWLNLDWGEDELGNTHPGGPFFQGDKYIVVSIRDRFGKTPLNEPENAKSMAKPSSTSESAVMSMPSTVPGSTIQDSYSAQAYSAQPYNAQPYSAQPYSAQPYSAQPYSAQPYNAQPYSAAPISPGQTIAPGAGPIDWFVRS